MKKLLIALGVLGLGTLASADIKYTTEMIAASAPEGMPKTKMVRAVKPNFERTETQQEIGAYQMQTISIRECGKKETIQLAPNLKLYAVVPDSEGSGMPGMNAPIPQKPTAGKATTGKMILTYNIKDLGEETLLGNFKTRRYMTETQTQSSGCAGEGTAKVKQEIWVSDVRDVNPCPQTNGHPAASIAQGMSHKNCAVEVETKGDFKKYGEIMNGLILRQKTYDGDKLLMTTEVTSLSQAKLGNELFTAPADFKKVSAAELQKAQSEAMVKAMMAGFAIGNN